MVTTIWSATWALAVMPNPARLTSATAIRKHSFFIISPLNVLEPSLEATAAAGFYSASGFGVCVNNHPQDDYTPLDGPAPVTVTEQVVKVLSPPAATRRSEKLESYA
jgi:hypothetical protein